MKSFQYAICLLIHFFAICLSLAGWSYLICIRYLWISQVGMQMTWVPPLKKKVTLHKSVIIVYLANDNDIDPGNYPDG